MSRSNVFKVDLLNLILNGVPVAGIAATPAMPLPNPYISVQAADPGDGGNQAPNKAAYRRYARVHAKRKVMRRQTGRRRNPSA